MRSKLLYLPIHRILLCLTLIFHNKNTSNNILDYFKFYFIWVILYQLFMHLYILVTYIFISSLEISDILETNSHETSGIRSPLSFGPRNSVVPRTTCSPLRSGTRNSVVPRTSWAPANFIVRCSFLLYPWKQKRQAFACPLCFHETSGIRTPDNLIKSQVLYHLS